MLGCFAVLPKPITGEAKDILNVRMPSNPQLRELQLGVPGFTGGASEDLKTRPGAVGSKTAENRLL